MSELVPWLVAACALALAAYCAIGWHGERAWSRVQSLYLNALWSERERRYAQQPLVVPPMPEAQAVALAPDRADQLEAIAAERPEPPPLADARTLVRWADGSLERIITDRQTVGMTLPRWDGGLKRG